MTLLFYGQIWNLYSVKMIIFIEYAIDELPDILDTGAERFIQKPFLIAPFAEKLKEVLEGK